MMKHVFVYYHLCLLMKTMQHLWLLLGIPTQLHKEVQTLCLIKTEIIK